MRNSQELRRLIDNSELELKDLKRGTRGLIKSRNNMVVYGVEAGEGFIEDLNNRIRRSFEKFNDKVKAHNALVDEYREAVKEEKLTDEQKARRAERMAARAAERQQRLNGNRLA